MLGRHSFTLGELIDAIYEGNTHRTSRIRVKPIVLRYVAAGYLRVVHAGRFELRFYPDFVENPTERQLEHREQLEEFAPNVPFVEEDPKLRYYPTFMSKLSPK